jgi:hypothetical protein
MRKRAIAKAQDVAERTGRRPAAKNRPAANEPELTKYTCKSCDRVYFDTNMYFYGVKSINCLWCTKFPVTKTQRSL